MNGHNFIKGVNAPDGIHDNIEFNEYKTPEYWLKRRARRAFWNHVAPVGICVGMFLAFVIMGFIDVGF
jgi:hypothetical protein